MEKKSGEIWKRIVFDKLKEEVTHLHVSNLGRIKSQSKVASGEIIHGSLKEGYPALSLRYMRERSPKDEKTVQKWRDGIDAIKKEIDAMSAERGSAKKGSKIIKTLTESIKAKKKELLVAKKEYASKLKVLEKGRTVYYGGLIHKLVAQKFLKKPSSKHIYIVHIDYNKENNAVSNLKWVTKEEWITHQGRNPKVKAARKVLVNSHKGIKLNDKDVIKIKKALASKKRASDLAIQFNVSEMAIYRIKRGENWSHIKI